MGSYRGRKKIWVREKTSLKHGSIKSKAGSGPDGQVTSVEYEITDQYGVGYVLLPGNHIKVNDLEEECGEMNNMRNTGRDHMAEDNASHADIGNGFCPSTGYTCIPRCSNNDHQYTLYAYNGY